MNTTSSIREWGRAALVMAGFATVTLVACNTSDSVGALGDGGRTGGTSGDSGQAVDTPLPSGCPLVLVVCDNGYTKIENDRGCMECLPDYLAGSSGGIRATGGSIGSGGVVSSGGFVGSGGVVANTDGGKVDAAADARNCETTVGVCGYGYVMQDVFGCPVCAPVDAGRDLSVDTPKDGVVTCGSATCGTGEYCCNAACSMCAPNGWGCIQGCGVDAGQDVASPDGCRAVPANDATRCGGTRPPHYYVCTLTMLAAPCSTLTIGDATNTFCCP